MTNPCVTCKIDVFIKCPWVIRGAPVKGWDAKKIKREKWDGTSRSYDGYDIKSCPNYVKG